MLSKYENYEIVNLDNLTYCANLANLYEVSQHPNYKFIKGDITDKNILADIIQDVDAVMNFAAETHVDNSILTPEIFVKTNVLGTQCLLDMVRKYEIKKYIQISTDEVYGELGAQGCFEETTPINPSSPYSATKASGDILALSYFKTYKLPIIVTRCSNNYGPNQFVEKLIPFFISKLLKNEKIPLYGDGKNVRDWIYVYDHCSALDLVLHKGRVGEIYNIGANCEKSNVEIAQILLKALGKDDSYIEYVKDRPGHDRRYAISNKKIKAELGWRPQKSFEEGIKQTIDWYINNTSRIKEVLK